MNEDKDKQPNEKHHHEKNIKEHNKNLKEQPKKEENKELEEAKIKINFLEEEVLKAKADNINYRKRKDEEVSKMLEYANEDIIKDILPTIDNFERAINLDDTNLDDELSKFLAGFKMIYCHLTSILEKYEVKEIIGLNEPFNPNIQQAVLVEKVKDVNPGIVVEVMQKGYMLKGKVIRPAMVKVSE
jgi:molecular chaperone GrpE